MFLFIYIYIYKETYYKKLVHMVMEVKNSQDLQLASKKHRKANSRVSIWVQRLENQESWWYHFKYESASPKVPTWKHLQKMNSSLPCLSFYPDFQWTRGGSLTLQMAICFTQPTNKENKTKSTTNRHIQNNVWADICTSYGPVNLTYKMNPHISTPCQLGTLYVSWISEWRW